MGLVARTLKNYQNNYLQSIYLVDFQSNGFQWLSARRTKLIRLRTNATKALSTDVGRPGCFLVGLLQAASLVNH